MLTLQVFSSATFSKLINGIKSKTSKICKFYHIATMYITVTTKTVMSLNYH